MAKTIWKFKLEAEDVQAVTMPVGAQILTAQAQGNDLCLWAEVDPGEKRTEKRLIRVYGTGHPMDGDEELDYIGTVQLHGVCGSTLVLHVYEIMGD